VSSFKQVQFDMTTGIKSLNTCEP